VGTTRKIPVQAGKSIHELAAAGRSQRSIARELGLDRKTVGRWLARGGAHEGADDPKPARGAKASPEVSSEAAGELEILRELADQLRGMLRGAALAPADVARLGAELRATLKRIGIVEALARMSQGEASRDEAAAFVRAKLGRMIEARAAGQAQHEDAAEAEDEPRKVSAR
jgi:transposase